MSCGGATSHLSPCFTTVWSPDKLRMYSGKIPPITRLLYTPETTVEPLDPVEPEHWEDNRQRQVELSRCFTHQSFRFNSLTFLSSPPSLQFLSLSAPVVYLRTGELREALSSLHFTSASPDSIWQPHALPEAAAKWREHKQANVNKTTQVKADWGAGGRS